MVTSSEASKFIYRDESAPPLTPFEVKVGVYNNKGDGPFSQIVVIYSAEGGQFLYPCYLYSTLNILFCYMGESLLYLSIRSTNMPKEEINLTHSPTTLYIYIYSSTIFPNNFYLKKLNFPYVLLDVLIS